MSVRAEMHFNHFKFLHGDLNCRANWNNHLVRCRATMMMQFFYYTTVQRLLVQVSSISIPLLSIFFSRLHHHIGSFLRVMLMVNECITLQKERYLPPLQEEVETANNKCNSHQERRVVISYAPL